jgi:hypothetical protein
MDPKDYGPIVWRVIHRAALLTPSIHCFRKYIVYLERFFPCRECRAHLRENLHKLAPCQGPSAFTWSVDLHNVVNRMLNKPLVGINEAHLAVDASDAMADYFDSLFVMLKFLETPDASALSREQFLQMAMDLARMMRLPVSSNDLKSAILCTPKVSLFFAVMRVYHKNGGSKSATEIAARYYSPANYHLVLSPRPG